MDLKDPALELTASQREKMQSQNSFKNAAERSNDAGHAALVEHQMTLMEALRKYPKAVFWSVMVSTVIIMEGYDIVLVTSLFAHPAFARHFGVLDPDGTYQIPGLWQSIMAISPIFGAIIGSGINGYLSFRYGSRNVLLVSLALVTAFISLLFFSNTPGMLVAGLLLCGVPWGVFATIAPTYASDVAPLALRGYLTVFVNLCWAAGQLIAAGVLRAATTRMDEWAYRIPFAVQWAWILPLVAILWFAPESPWWLVREDKISEAIRSITRLSNSSVKDAEATVSLIVQTHKIEDEAKIGTGYLDCFSSTNLRRTEIVSMVFAAQVWCGSPLGGTPAYFLVRLGIDPSVAFDFSIGGLTLACVGTALSWPLLTYFGRRTLYVGGLGALAILMLLVGIVASVPVSRETQFGEAGLVLAWLLAFHLTVGPVCYAIIVEIPSSNLRGKSICLARISYYISQGIGNTIHPYMINPYQGNWSGKAAFFWAGTCAVFFLWSFFRLPETMNRSYAELDLLFLSNFSARKFRNCEINTVLQDNEERLKKSDRLC